MVGNTIVALTVIGAGFGRTGTLSMKLALEMLGIGPCYHMKEVARNPGHVEWWNAALEGRSNWNRLFDGYGAAVDWPTAYFWRELVAHYPDAKVLLTIRSTDSWIQSMKATLLEAHRRPIPTDDDVRAARMRMNNEVIVHRTFGDNIDDLAHVAAVYERHNEEVRRTIPADRLLVFELGQGWEPLCEFLGIPIPAAEFPRTNTTEDFRKMIQSGRSPAPTTG